MNKANRNNSKMKILNEFFKRIVKVPLALIVFWSVICIYVSYMLPTYISVTLSFSLLILAYFSGVLKDKGKRLVIFIAFVFALVTSSYVVYTLKRDLDVSLTRLTVEVTSVRRKLSGDITIYGRCNGTKVSVVLPDNIDISGINPGTVIEGEGKVSEPLSPGNPGEFDYKSYLRRKGIKYTVYYKDAFVYQNDTFLSRVYLGINGIGFSMKNVVYSFFSNVLSEEDSSLISAVCLGDTSLLEDNITKSFQLSGCSHLLAVSGTHFSGYLMVLPYVLSGLDRKNKRLSVCVYSLFCIVLGLLTGWSESVTRASVMGITGFASRDSLAGLSLAGILMISNNPFAALSPGFGMSFMCALSIRLLSRRFKDMLENRHCPVILSGSIAATLAAQIGMIPFWISVSARIGIITIVFQIIGSFLAQIACVFFIPTFILLLFFPGGIIADCIVFPVIISLRIMKWTMCFAPGLSAYSFNSGKLTLIQVICIISIALYLLLPASIIRRKVFYLCVFLMCVVVGGYIPEIISPTICIVRFIDVGQGDCALICAGKTTVLIDSGVYDEGDKTVSDVLLWYGITHIDYAIMSHWDADHAAGLFALKDKGMVDEIYTPFDGVNEEIITFLQSNAGINEEYETYIRTNTIKLSQGDEIILSDKVVLKFIWPYEVSDGQNQDSFVIELIAGGTKVLFTGDIPDVTEQEMLSCGLLDDIDILKVSHHGSKYSTTIGFLNVVQPECAVISVGRNNFYGHPSDETISRLNECGCEIFDTSKNGLIEVKIRNSAYLMQRYRG